MILSLIILRPFQSHCHLNRFLRFPPNNRYPIDFRGGLLHFLSLLAMLLLQHELRRQQILPEQSPPPLHALAVVALSSGGIFRAHWHIAWQIEAMHALRISLLG